jgi:malto-oligosyltrehalose trehalohydrolase
MPTSEPHSWGAHVIQERGVRFRVWAPAHRELSVAIAGEPRPLDMNPLPGGWFQLTTERARAGSRYQYVLPGGRRLPDPASRFQPDDVHGVSEVFDPDNYRWTDDEWPGRAWQEAVVYELHVGTFTPAGTFAGAREKLQHLVDLGVSAIELMPIAQFPGRRNWGYDGVYPFAPAASYGRPEDLQALVDTAHGLGMMVLLDVVYNHFGPEGNYIGAYAPDFFTTRHETPWGAGINFDGPESTPVRRFFLENALYWLREFHFDGLRLDAVHAIVDDSPRHLLAELAQHLHTSIADRPIHLILENEENDAHYLERAGDGRPISFTAQWNDDLHHVLHTAASGEAEGYYEEYRGDTQKLGRALAEGFVFQGEMMRFRGRTRGTPSAHLPADAFVAFIQNHDQIGNRAFGERLNQIAPTQAVRAIAAVYLLLPQIPMLFMGEEWNSQQPFPFFCDFHDELANRVREGRRLEFARFPRFQDPAQRQRIPDPQSERTFESAKLDWDALTQEPHGEWFNWYRSVLRIRAREIVPRMRRFTIESGEYTALGALAVQVRWRVGDREQLELIANLSGRPVEHRWEEAGRCFFEHNGPANHALPPWSVFWRIRHTRAQPGSPD